MNIIIRVKKFATYINENSLDKGFASGYMGHNRKLVSKNISGKKFCYVEEIKDSPKGSYIDEIREKYPELFDDTILYYKENISKTEIYNTIEPFIKSKGFVDLIDRNNNDY